MCKSLVTSSVRRSTPALEQRAASIVTDFCQKYGFKYSKLNLREYKGHLHVDCHLIPNGKASLDTIEHWVENLEERVVFLLSEASGMHVDILCHIEIGFQDAEHEAVLTFGFPRHYQRECICEDIQADVAVS